MPPQPLSFVKRDAEVKWGSHDSFKREPELCALAMQAIASWAHAEYFMRGILVKMLGAKAEPAAKMYAALNSSQAQFDALSAAAKCTLASPHLEMFGAIMAITRRAARARHRLAHDIWCSSDDLPGALLLLEASAAFNFTIESHAFRFETPLAAALKGIAAPDFPIDRVYVYRERDLQEIVLQIAEAGNFLAEFQTVATPGSPAAASNYYELSLEPRIQEELARQSKRSGNGP